MAMIEVEEDVAELGKLAQKVMKGKGRKSLLKLVKEADPELPPLPELMIHEENEERINAATKPLQDKISAMERERADEKALQNLQARRSVVPHITGDALKKLEQFMVDNGIANYEIAEREMKRLDGVAAPRNPTIRGRAEMPADNDGLYKDPAGWRNKTLHNMIDDHLAGKPI